MATLHFDHGSIMVTPTHRTVLTLLHKYLAMAIDHSVMSCCPLLGTTTLKPEKGQLMPKQKIVITPLSKSQVLLFCKKNCFLLRFLAAIKIQGEVVALKFL